MGTENIFLFNTKYNVGALFRALKQTGYFQSLAEPNLIAYNNQEASFLAGGEFPVPVGADDGEIEIEFKDAVPVRVQHLGDAHIGLLRQQRVALDRGRPAGTIGDASVFSFNRHKVMQSGEGGVVLSAGRILDAPAEGLTLSSGLGARHWAAAAISRATNAVAVAVSETSGTVRIFQNGEVVLDVTDAGPGIPAADLERVFDPFWRGAGAQAAGSGLGLAICRAFVEANGGSVAVVPGAGATLRFRLPVPESEPVAPDE